MPNPISQITFQKCLSLPANGQILQVSKRRLRPGGENQRAEWSGIRLNKRATDILQHLCAYCGQWSVC